MIERSVDPQDGIILVVSVGQATQAEIDAHYERLREMVVPVRRGGGPVRVLSDQTRATRLSDALNRRIREQMERTFFPGDRVALVMASGEDQVHARSVLGTGRFGVFASRLAAEMWLMQPDQAPPKGH